MNDQALNELSISTLMPRLQNRDVRAADVVERCIERIEQREADVGAWALFSAAAAREAAAELDRGPIRGPLHGIPVGIKDIVDVAGWPTELGSEIHAGRLAARDAACSGALRAAGALLMGKTVTTEFGYFRPGKTANPRNLRHTPGGSSSGSAAAVADFMVPAALGAQTAGSVIRPAAYCGVVGFKSSHGAFDLDGVQPLAPSLDSLGWLVRAVEDAEILRAVLKGEPYRPLPADLPAPVRIGVCKTNEWRHAGDKAQHLLRDAAQSFGAGGAKVVSLRLPAEFDGLVDVHAEIMSFEATRALGAIVDRHADKVSVQLRVLVDAGRRIDEAKYNHACRKSAAAISKLGDLFSELDAILAPSATGGAPAGLDSTGDPIFSRVWTLLRLPAIALPLQLGRDKLPLGVQLIGAFAADRHLLAVAKRVFQSLAPSWLERRDGDA